MTEPFFITAFLNRDNTLPFILREIETCKQKATKISCRPEKSSLLSLISKISSLLVSNKEEIEHFIDNYIKAASFLFQKTLPLQVIDNVIRQLSKHFDIEPCRTFIKHKETQRLVLAYYFDSWNPFLSHTVFAKTEKKFRVFFQSLTYIDKNNRRRDVNYPFDMTFDLTGCSKSRKNTNSSENSADKHSNDEYFIVPVKRIPSEPNNYTQLMDINNLLN